jgi:hypothetical protein
MVMIEAVVVLGIAGLIVYGIIRLLVPSPDRPSASRAGQWVAVHYDVKGATRVALQKTSPTGASVLDEHIVATIAVHDPEYDTKFLTAMAVARERRALFESEDD